MTNGTNSSTTTMINVLRMKMMRPLVLPGHREESVDSLSILNYQMQVSLI